MKHAEVVICERLAEAFFGADADRVRASEKHGGWRLIIAPSLDDEISGDADTVEEVARILSGRELRQCDACCDLHFADEVTTHETPGGEGSFCLKCWG